MKNLPMPTCLMLTSMLLGTGACTTSPTSPDTPEQADAADINILYVSDDGSMTLNNRSIDPDNVVIYSDGYGGERAALKMRVPLHPDYYRDTIIVERETGADKTIVD